MPNTFITDLLELLKREENLKRINRLSEMNLLKILADVNMDMQICKLEGWNPLELPTQLYNLIGGILKTN